jgi:hypothetical protein
MFHLLRAFFILYSIASISQTEARELLTCGIPTRDGLERYEACAVRNDESISLLPKYFKKIEFDKSGLAGLYVDRDCYWVNLKGLSRKTFCFDNGPDYFIEGYARYIDKYGKFGFIDQKLKIVISPQYDFVFPFDKGRAKFCNGCKESRLHDGERSIITGGAWGTIDKHGMKLSE